MVKQISFIDDEDDATGKLFQVIGFMKYWCSNDKLTELNPTRGKRKSIHNQGDTSIT